MAVQKGARKGGGGPKGPGGPTRPPEGERPQHRPEGREHQVHREILDRRMRGGPPPTPEAYARALKQWNELPGSVMRPPTDVMPPEEPAKPAGEGGEGLPRPQGEDEEQ